MKRLLFSTLFLLMTLSATVAQKSDSTEIYLVINGRKATQAEFTKVQQDTTAVIHFLKADRAMTLFGPFAKNGALIITVPSDEVEEKGIFIYGKQRISADSINYSNVSRIDVIRGRQAISLYGPAGKDGVYVIHEDKPQFSDVILRITDKNGKPVRNATVKNENGSILAKSDKCGWVSLENFSLGNTVTISAGKNELSNLVVIRQVMNVKL